MQNWMEHNILITNTNESYMRLLKIDKSRAIDYPTCYYGIEWDAEKFWLTNVGVVEDWKHYLVTEAKKTKWLDALDYMMDEFTTADWLNKVEVIDDMSKSTAEKWLAEIKRCNIITGKQGRFKKNLPMIENESE